MVTDVSNSKVVKFLSLEMIASLLMSALLVGISYGSLSKEQQSQGDEVKSLKVKQQEIKSAVEGIRVSIATVEANQSNQAESARQATLERRRIEDKLDRITDRLLSD